MLPCARVGGLGYAVDITLLAPTPSAMRVQLKFCEEYAREYRIIFNAAKSATLCVSSRQPCCHEGLQFFIDDKCITSVNEFTHLGHIISSKLDDKSEIHAKRNSLCGKINNVL